jgi:protein-tyrosine phosphatase
MLKGIANFRDLGGIPAADGKAVRPGMLYRSAHICKISKATAQKLRERKNLATVVDLRTPSELAAQSDVLASGMRYMHLPPLTDEQNPAVTMRTRRSILKNIMKKEGGARRHLSDTYRTMVTQKSSLEAFGAFLHLLAENKEEAVLWHCTQGKDRTGIAAAVILLALGVDRKEIEKDYLRTNKAAFFKNALIYFGVWLITFSKHTADELSLLLKAEECYLEAAFDEIDRTYGGTDGFLHGALGLTDSDISTLRQTYLV